MLGVIYARYSSDNQREESIDGQIRECKAFAEQNDIQIVTCYVDRAMSAKTDHRPDFQRMIKDSASHKFEVVIVWKLDRFARNRYDSAHYKSILRKNGVKVVSATEAISEGAEGILLESLLEGMAEYYSVELAEKTLRGMTENALKCKCNGSLPLGYTKDKDLHYQIDPLYAPIVRDIFEMYKNGNTMKEIAKDLEVRGIHNRKGRCISENVISHMLSNRRYIGEYRFHDTVIPGGIPAIISETLFEDVQRRMQKNSKAPARFKAEDQYLLSTKLFCGKCHRMMAGESGTGRNEAIYRYYKCSGVKRKLGCDKKSVKKEWIEDLVIRELKKIISKDHFAEDVIQQVEMMHRQEDMDLSLLQKQLEETKKGIDNLVNAIQMGICNEATRTRMQELEGQKAEIEIKIAKLEIEKPKLTEEQIRFWVSKFTTFDTRKLEERQKMIDTFVNAVFLYDDKVVITFNFDEKARTVTFTELEASGILSSTDSIGEPQRNPCFTRVFVFL